MIDIAGVLDITHLGIYGTHMETGPVTGETTRSITSRVATLVSTAITASDLTPNAVATRAGIPRETFRRRLAAQSSFTVEELGAVASVLGLDVADLIEGEAA